MRSTKRSVCISICNGQGKHSTGELDAYVARATWGGALISADVQQILAALTIVIGVALVGDRSLLTAT